MSKNSLYSWTVCQPDESGIIASFAEARWNDINEQLLEIGHEVGDVVSIDPDAFWEQHFGRDDSAFEELESNFDLFVRATESGEMVSVDVAKKVIEYVREFTSDVDGLDSCCADYEEFVDNYHELLEKYGKRMDELGS